MNTLPESWVDVHLSELLATVHTTDPTSSPESEFTYIDIGSIDNAVGVVTSPKRLLGKDAPSRARQLVRKGDVLFSTVRPNLRAIASVPAVSSPVASTGFCVLRPAAGVDSSYLYFLARSEEFIQQVLPLQRGVSYPAVRDQDVLSQKVALAPTAEQTRIAEKLEELFTELDAGAAELLAAQKKLQQYRQSLLKSAVEGALTADWRAANPPQETGEALLARILQERRARWEGRQLARFEAQGNSPPRGWQKKYTEPVPPQTNYLPALPQGWTWASLGQLLESLSSGSRDWSPYYDRGNCVFVMAQNVRPWRPDFSFRQFVDPPVGDRDRARSEVKKDDLLVTIVGANTGQVCRIHEEFVSHFVCQSVALLRLVHTDLSEFLNAVLNSEGHGQRQFREMNYGAGRPHLSFDQLESVCIPLPPCDEQVEIVRQVESALSATNQMESEFLLLRRQFIAQRQNILRAAFAGQLVPQDPTDEPASALLARIRAERATQATGKKTTRARMPRRMDKETP